jgi:hypothetical protein
MIEMRMTGDCQQWRMAQPGKMFRQAYDAEPRIEQKAAVSSAHVPYVAAVKDIDVGLEEVAYP